MRITVSHNMPEIIRKLAGLRDDIKDRVLASSLNKVVAQAKTKMAKEITTEYNVTSSYAKERLSIAPASFKAGKFEATLIGGDGKKRSANVFRFMEKSVSLAQGRKRAKAGTLNQLHFKIKRSGGLKIIKGAFLGNRGRTVFVRVGSKRLPIKAVSTIDIPSMFNQRRINAAVVAEINAKLPVIVDRDIKFFTDKFNGK